MAPHDRQAFDGQLKVRTTRHESRAWWLVAGLAASALGPYRLVQAQGAVSPVTQDASGDEIARQVERIRRAAPGVSGDGERRGAIQTLVRLPSVEAHAALREQLRAALRAGDEAMLRLGLEAIRDQIEFDLADHKLATPDRSVRKLVLVYAGYLAEWFEWLDAADRAREPQPRSPESAPASASAPRDDRGAPASREARNPAAGSGASAPSAPRALEADLTRVLARIPNPERREAFRDALVGDSTPRRRGALRAVPLCRDLSLAPLVAPYLDVPELRPLTDKSLRLLTFHVEGFASAAEFAEWQRQHPGVTYAELESAAARAFMAGMQDLLATRMARTREASDLLARRLARSLVTQTPVRWSDLLDLIRNDKLDELRPTMLKELIAASEPIRKAPPAEPDPGLRGLKEFLEESWERRSDRPAVSEGAAVTFEAYLLVCGLGREWQARGRRLALDLAQADPAARDVALRALRFVPGDESIVGLLGMVGGAENGTRRSATDVASLAAALSTLEVLGPPVSDVLFTRWLDTLGEIVVSGNSALDEELRCSALRVLGSAQREPVLARLEKILAREDQSSADAAVRTQAMTWFGTVGLRMLAGPNGASVADRMMNMASARLRDANVGVRLEAAACTAKLLDQVKTERVHSMALGVLDEAFAVETDEKVAQHILGALRALDPTAPNVGTTVGLLCRRLQSAAGATPPGGTAPSATLVDRIVEVLVALVGLPGAQPLDRCQAVEVLTRLGRREMALSILTAFNPCEVKNGNRARALAGALEALAAPSAQPVHTPDELRLAERVIECSQGQRSAEPRLELARASVLELLNRFSDAAVVVSELVPKADDKTRGALRLRLGQLKVKTGRFEEALAAVQGLEPLADVLDVEARAYGGLQRWVEAEQAARRFLEAGSAVAGSRPFIVATLLLAECAAAQGRAAEARSLVATVRIPDADAELSQRLKEVNRRIKEVEKAPGRDSSR